MRESTSAQIEEEAQRLYGLLGNVTDFKTGCKYTLEHCRAAAPLTLAANNLKKENDAVILAHYYCAPEIVYGNIPDIKVSLSGFIGGENAETEGIALVPVYEDGTAIDVIRDVSANYRIVLQLLPYSGTNYTVDYSSVACNVRILPKTVSVVAGAPYEKPVDGTLEAVGFGTDNYVIEGLFDGDIGYVYLEYDAILNSAEPGNATVNVRINGLIGAKRDNYTLGNDTFSVPATILKLADVTMSDAVYSYDTEAKPVTPVLTNVLEGVTYSVEYSGRGGTVYEASENAPINAGEYLVRCYLKLNDYERFAAECYLTIEKITPTIYFDGVFTQTYGTFTPITVYLLGKAHQRLAVIHVCRRQGRMPVKGY